jgi:pyrimidine deaminase RibD-like protein
MKKKKKKHERTKKSFRNHNENQKETSKFVPLPSKKYLKLTKQPCSKVLIMPGIMRHCIALAHGEFTVINRGVKRIKSFTI